MIRWSCHPTWNSSSDHKGGNLSRVMTGRPHWRDPRTSRNRFRVQSMARIGGMLNGLQFASRNKNNVIDWIPSTRLLIHTYLPYPCCSGTLQCKATVVVVVDVESSGSGVVACRQRHSRQAHRNDSSFDWAGPQLRCQPWLLS